MHKAPPLNTQKVCVQIRVDSWSAQHQGKTAALLSALSQQLPRATIRAPHPGPHPTRTLACTHHTHTCTRALSANGHGRASLRLSPRRSNGRHARTGGGERLQCLNKKKKVGARWLPGHPTVQRSEGGRAGAAGLAPGAWLGLGGLAPRLVMKLINKPLHKFLRQQSRPAMVELRVPTELARLGARGRSHPRRRPPRTPGPAPCQGEGQGSGTREVQWGLGSYKTHPDCRDIWALGVQAAVGTWQAGERPAGIQLTGPRSQRGPQQPPLPCSGPCYHRAAAWMAGEEPGSLRKVLLLQTRCCGPTATHTQPAHTPFCVPSPHK